MLRSRQFISENRSRDLTSPLFNTSKDNEQPTIDYEDDDVDLGYSVGEYPNFEAEEELLHSDPGFEDGQPPDTFSSNMSSITSASFLQLQRQMLRIFESAQSEAAELRQRVNELEEEKSEIEKEGEDAYRARETELLARVNELVQKVERLKVEDHLKDEVLRENARLVDEMDAMQTEWTQKLSTISEEKDKERRMLGRAYNKKITSLKDDLAAAEKSIEDHAMTKALRAENTEFQRRLQELKEHITVLESKKAAPPRKVKKPSQSVTASDNLRKLYVADVNSEFAKKLEEQNRVAIAHAATMEQTVSKLRQRVEELERSRSPIDSKNNKVADLEYCLGIALEEIDRLEAVVAEQSSTFHKQEHENHGLPQRHMLSEGYQTSLPNSHMKSTKELEHTPATPSSVSDDSFGEEATSAESEDQLQLPAEVTNEFESQYLDEEQTTGDDAISEGKLDVSKETDAGLQEELETLRRQNQYLQEKNDLFNIQEKKWRRTFEDFTHRAADVQRKDASKRQIKKGFKHLRKIIREGDLESV